MNTLRLIRQHPFLFALGCVLTFALIMAVSLLFGLLFGLDPQMIGRNMAGVVLVSLIPGAIGFTKYAINWKVEKRATLDTPIKRKMFLFVPLGGLLFPISWLCYGYEFGGYFGLVFTPANWPYRSGGNIWAIVFFWVGIVSVAAGLVFSYLYDGTIGRVRAWIKTGE
jgi:hypothetical protein